MDYSYPTSTKQLLKSKHLRMRYSRIIPSKHSMSLLYEITAYFLGSSELVFSFVSEIISPEVLFPAHTRSKNVPEGHFQWFSEIKAFPLQHNTCPIFPKTPIKLIPSAHSLKPPANVQVCVLNRHSRQDGRNPGDEKQGAEFSSITVPLAHKQAGHGHRPQGREQRQTRKIAHSPEDHR